LGGRHLLAPRQASDSIPLEEFLPRPVPAPLEHVSQHVTIGQQRVSCYDVPFQIHSEGFLRPLWDTRRNAREMLLVHNMHEDKAEASHRTAIPTIGHWQASTRLCRKVWLPWTASSSRSSCFFESCSLPLRTVSNCTPFTPVPPMCPSSDEFPLILEPLQCPYSNIRNSNLRLPRIRAIVYLLT
jgi:hypothetical protein